MNAQHDCEARGSSLLDFTALDFETGSGYRNSVCQIGLVKVVQGVIVDEYCSLIRPPGNYIWQGFSDIHGIYPEQTRSAPLFAESYPQWRHFVEGQTLIAHNMAFDLSCLCACLRDFCALEPTFTTYCTMKIWAGAFADKSLATCCKMLDIDLGRHHDALDDARSSAVLFIRAVQAGRVE